MHAAQKRWDITLGGWLLFNQFITRHGDNMGKHIWMRFSIPDSVFGEANLDALPELRKNVDGLWCTKQVFEEEEAEVPGAEGMHWDSAERSKPPDFVVHKGLDFEEEPLSPTLVQPAQRRLAINTQQAACAKLHARAHVRA